VYVIHRTIYITKTEKKRKEEYYKRNKLIEVKLGTKTLPWHPPSRYGFPSKPLLQEHVKVVFRLEGWWIVLQLDVLLVIGSEECDVYGSPHSNATGNVLNNSVNKSSFWNQYFSSTKNATLHSGKSKIGSLFIGAIVVLKATRSEGIVVWQQLMPLQLLAFLNSVLLSQIDKHPETTEPPVVFDTIEAKLLQPMAMNLFSDWEKMKGLFVKSTFGLLFVPLLQIKNVG
jgi:hypothetical protein